VLRQVVLEKPPSSGSLSVEAWIGIGVGAAIALVLGAGAVVFGISRMHKAPDEKVGSATQGGGNQTVFEIRCDDAEVCVCVFMCERVCLCTLHPEPRFLSSNSSQSYTLNPRCFPDVTAPWCFDRSQCRQLCPRSMQACPTRCHISSRYGAHELYQ
jgi:hypothetical protein